MECVKNSTKDKAESTEPRGLQVLRSHPTTEQEAVKALSLCCQGHPNGCGYEKQCHRRFMIEGERWPRQAKVDYVPKRQTTEEKYADWLGQLNRHVVVSRLRERPIY